jgi:hypothetical protein
VILQQRRQVGLSKRLIPWASRRYRWTPPAGMPRSHPGPGRPAGPPQRRRGAASSPTDLPRTSTPPVGEVAARLSPPPARAAGGASGLGRPGERSRGRRDATPAPNRTTGRRTAHERGREGRPVPGHLATVHGCGHPALRPVTRKGQGPDLREARPWTRSLRGLYGRWGITPTRPPDPGGPPSAGRPAGPPARRWRYAGPQPTSWTILPPGAAQLAACSPASTPLRTSRPACSRFALHGLQDELWPAAMYLASLHIWKAAGAATARRHTSRRRVVVNEAQLLTAHAGGGALITGGPPRPPAVRGPSPRSARMCGTSCARPGRSSAGQQLHPHLRQDDQHPGGAGRNLRLSP